MTKEEVLKLALEALSSGEDIQIGSVVWTEYDSSLVQEAITAIKEALAEQPAQQEWKLVPVKPTEEMLKAMDECSTEGYDERLYAGHAASVYMAAVDVAPTPPQRTWFGLTDEEISNLWSWSMTREAELTATTQQHAFARAIEAAHGIKEKNT